VKTYSGLNDATEDKPLEKHRQAENLASLLVPAEQDVERGRTRPAREVIKEFKDVRNIQNCITTDQVKAFLRVLSSGEMTLSEAMKKLSLVHRSSFRSDYIHPALKKRLVEMTQPEAPRSPSQRYRLTLKGRGVLERLTK